ncbi:MAG: GAF domain-containing protein [Leptonema illini]|uniref:Metal dependent phosphohydrolase n=2 Tax=Leptonema illini TaxID=183 RepID=H2CBZ6_9LEPT|nr:HD family phosphohydrolase [Leptonema illini]EHQ08668.1 metal dependent phosphohydrolase [Leptonema illini DSM 21528]KAB2930694.1 MAG: GAF domain-containing protein [Leptonema illini]
MDSLKESDSKSDVRQDAPLPLSAERRRGTELARYVFLSPDIDSSSFDELHIRQIDNADHRAEPAQVQDRFVSAICIVTEQYADDNAAMLGQWLEGIFSREMLFLILCKRERGRNSFQGIPSELIYLIMPSGTPGPFLRQLVENAYREMSLRLDRLGYQTRLELSLQDMRRIIRIGQLLSTEKDFEVLIGKILHEAMGVVGADAGSIYVTEPYKGDRPEYLRFKKSALQLNASEFVLPIDARSIAGYVASSGAPLMIPDCYALSGEEPYRFNREYDQQHRYFTRSMLVIPMKNYRNEIIGVIQLINKKPEAGRSLRFEEMRDGAVRPFTTADMDKASAVAGQAAVAIENNRLINDINHLFEGFVRASVTAIEQRDPTTSGHSFRVAEYTVGLAEAVDRLSSGRFQHLKFTREQIREIRYASLLHDFGKVGVREQVLVKAKKLYPDQLNEIRWRFRYARKALEYKYSQKKLNYLKENGEGPFRDYERYIDAELAQKIEELQGMLQIVELSNEPNVVDGDSIVQIEQVALNRLHLDDGTIVPFLTDNELMSLQVRRGNLDQRERLEIESHVTHTYRFLVQIPWTGDLKRVPDIAYGHHEKLDGSGYPLGLNRPEILPQTRMMTIADIYDALTAPDRPYKKSLHSDAALDILGKEARDGHLDPEMLKVFIEAKVFEKRGEGAY